MQTYCDITNETSERAGLGGSLLARQAVGQSGRAADRPASNSRIVLTLHLKCDTVRYSATVPPMIIVVYRRRHRRVIGPARKLFPVVFRTWYPLDS